MAEIDSPADTPDDSAALTRRVRSTAPTTSMPRREVRSAERAARKATAPRTVSPLKSLAILGAVGAMVATVALPAYAAWQPTSEATTLQDAAEGSAQSMQVQSEVSSPELAGAAYAATTPDEIEKEKARLAAIERAKAQAEAEAAAEAAQEEEDASEAPAPASVDNGPEQPNPGGAVDPIAESGQVVFPLAAGSYTIGERYGAPRPGRIHEGTDFLANSGTPIYAMADGCVSNAGWLGGFGNAVILESKIGGSVITTLYAHMSSTPSVGSGQCVQAGEYLGPVGNTGFSFGSHMHFELSVNGGKVDSLAWLQANAG